MNDHAAPLPFPRAPLFGAVALVGLALISVAFVRLTGVGATHTPDSPAVVVRDFRFEDRPDGSIAVIDANLDRQVEVVTGANGFLRGPRPMHRTMQST